jgi:hypothetical protein
MTIVKEVDEKIYPQKTSKEMTANKKFQVINKKY